jgi:hypothetical protein
LALPSDVEYANLIMLSIRLMPRTLLPPRYASRQTTQHADTSLESVIRPKLTKDLEYGRDPMVASYQTKLAAVDGQSEEDILRIILLLNLADSAYQSQLSWLIFIGLVVMISACQE